MRISLFIPCFVEQCFPKAAIAMADLFEGLGHSVDVPPGQTCCGQPAFNSGYWDETRAVAARHIACFADSEVVVGPSGSCVAMMKNFFPEIFAGRPEEAAAKDLAGKVYEFSEFMVGVLGVEDVGARLAARATFHDGCHGLRELHLKSQPRKLLAKVKELELVEMAPAENCCGFGGTFSVKFPAISAAMGEVKADSIAATGADVVISCDPSCLMQIGGIMKRQGRPIRCMHIAEVLVCR
jgi:L-lactate dehydrogenase complex protein LldE